MNINRIQKNLNKNFDQITRDINFIKNKLIEINNKLESTNAFKNKEKESRGKLCSVSGLNYEKKIYNIVKKTKINGELFNTQQIHEIGGSKAINDIQCNFKDYRNIGIEVKKCNTPDWMQCSIKFNKKNSIWEGSSNGKIPLNSREIFNNLLKNRDLYNGKVPPFLENNITHEEWINIKSESNIWKDIYFDIPNDTIKNIYSEKGCYYIQISEYGLYHLGNDICNFGVPEFIIDQQIRIRTKIHRRINRKGFCDMSVIAACQPKDIKKLKKSSWSLDNINKLPKNLKYIK
jgi:hypothetical protein